MNKIIGLLAVGVCVLVSMQARGGVVTGAAVWNFDSGLTTGSAIATPYSANTVNPAVFVNTGGSVARMTTISPNGDSSQTAAAGNAGLALQFAPKNGAKNVNGSSFTMSLTVASGVSALSSITLHYDYFDSGISSTAAVNTWTLNGVSSDATSTSITQNNGWHQATVTWNSIGGLGLSSGSTLSFVDALGGYVNGGNAKFDNISFDISGPSLVPEPITYAMALFGLVFIGTGVGRYYLGKSRKTA
jgi:hypothetical protein